MKDIDTQLFYQLKEVEERISWIHTEIINLLDLDKKTYLEVLSFSSKQFKTNIFIDYVVNEKNKEIIEDLLNKGIIETYVGKRNKEFIRFTEYGTNLVNKIQELTIDLLSKYFGTLEVRDKKNFSLLLDKFLN